MKITGISYIARPGQIKVCTKSLPAHLGQISCILKLFRLLQNRIAPGVFVISLIRASILIIGILFIPPALSAQIPPLTATYKVIHHVSCFGGADGTATVIAKGGVPPYSYLWNNGETTATATHLPARDNTVIVEDAQEISIQLVVPISQPNAIIASAIPEDAACNQLTGTITVNASGGTGSFKYKLEGNEEWQISNIFENLAPGMYFPMVLDAGDCEFLIDRIEIGNVPGPTILNCNALPPAYGLHNGSVEIIAEGISQPLVYSLTGDEDDWQESSSFFGLSAGFHMAWVMDKKGCKHSMEFEIPDEVGGNVNIRALSDEKCMSAPVELPVDGSNFIRISSFHIELEFDASILSYNSFASVHPLLPENGFDVNLSPDGNILLIDFSIASGSITIEDIQTLFMINFVALKPGESDLKWEQPNCKIFESAGNQVPVFYVDGKAVINPSPVISTTGGGEYYVDDELTLKVDPAETGVFYTWTSPAGLTHEGSAWYLGALDMNDNGQFTVTAVNEFSCGDKKTVDVVVIPCTINMLLPNAFTPGTDGINDVFKPVLSPCWEPDKYFMQVFNRWGEKIFETHDYKEGWDGNCKGVPMPRGLYLYRIVFDASSYDSNLVSNQLHGNVTIVR